MTGHPSPAAEPPRFRLPNDRVSHTHRFVVAGTKGYVIVGTYDDGVVGDIFVYIAKQGSTLSGVLRAWSIAVSLALQYGVPLGVLNEKFRHMKFEPAGLTETEGLPFAKSIIDYIFAWLERDFPGGRWRHHQESDAQAMSANVVNIIDEEIGEYRLTIDGVDHILFGPSEHVVDWARWLVRQPSGPSHIHIRAKTFSAMKGDET